MHHDHPQNRNRPHGKHYHNQEKKGRSPVSVWKSLLSMFLVGIAAYLALTSYSAAVMILVCVPALFFAARLSTSPARLNGPSRQHYVEQRVQRPIDEMTKHLALGETPILGEDGESTETESTTVQGLSRSVCSSLGNVGELFQRKHHGHLPATTKP